MKLSKSAFAAAAICSLAVMSIAGTAHAAFIADVTNPGDFIIGIDLDGNSSSPGGEGVGKVINNNLAKYLNFGGLKSGMIFTPTGLPSNYAVTSLTLTTGNDAMGRDPATFSLWGTSDSITSTANSAGAAETWAAITLNEMIALPTSRNTVGPTVSFSNNSFYSSYRLVFPTLRYNAGCWYRSCMQIAELQLGANLIAAPPSITIAAPPSITIAAPPSITVPEPSIIALFGLGLLGMGFARRTKA
jgi:hypothetical protein